MTIPGTFLSRRGTPESPARSRGFHRARRKGCTPENRKSPVRSAGGSAPPQPAPARGRTRDRPPLPPGTRREEDERAHGQQNKRDAFPPHRTAGRRDGSPRRRTSRPHRRKKNPIFKLPRVCVTSAPFDDRARHPSRHEGAEATASRRTSLRRDTIDSRPKSPEVRCGAVDLTAPQQARGDFVRAPPQAGGALPRRAVIAALHLVITDISGTAFPPADTRLRTVKGSCVAACSRGRHEPRLYMVVCSRSQSCGCAVPGAGLEPARPVGQRGLSSPCLHSTIRAWVPPCHPKEAARA